MKDLRNTLAAYMVDGASGYQTADGCWHDTATDLLHSGIIAFCGCGQPEESLRYILGGLELIEELRHSPQGSAEWDVWWEKHTARELAHHGSEGAARFFHYWCSDPPAGRSQLTEHGGCIPGWLTGDGMRLLSLLREWAELPEAQDR